MPTPSPWSHPWNATTATRISGKLETPKATFNGETRRTNIDTGQTEIDVKTNPYSDWKEWALLDDNAKYLPAFTTTGEDEIKGRPFQRAGT